MAPHGVLHAPDSIFFEVLDSMFVDQGVYGSIGDRGVLIHVVMLILPGVASAQHAAYHGWVVIMERDISQFAFLCAEQRHLAWSSHS